MREPGVLALVAGVVVALVLAVATPGRSAEIPFTKAQFFIEFNSTAGDAGVQAFFDGAAWKRVRIVGPKGHVIFDVKAKRGLRKIGLSELRFESEEPELQEILDTFPAGEYKFEGTTVEGDVLKGAATLSHDIPAAPVIVPVNPSNPIINWSWSPSGPGDPIQGLARFQVIVEKEGSGASLTIDLPPSATHLQVPPEFVEGGTTYKFEVLAVAANGNTTITESTFVTP
jgi:hypothetical protein